MMTSQLRHGAVILLLLGSVGFATGQTTSTTTATTAPVTTPKVRDLTPEQRTSIYSTVTRENRPPLKVDARVAVGAELPPSVELYTLPDHLFATIPAAKEYKYVVWNNQVVLVDPTSMKVVEILRQ